jgi:hypothetical protein
MIGHIVTDLPLDSISPHYQTLCPIDILPLQYMAYTGCSRKKDKKLIGGMMLPNEVTGYNFQSKNNLVMK